MRAKMKSNKQIEKAKKYCFEHKYKYTEPREKVLKAILESDDVLGAYDILEIMTTKDEKPRPPTIYRAIEFWETHGFIHRVESANGYIACNNCAKHDNVDLLICDSCHDVVEIHLKPLTERLENKTNLHGFQPRIATTEIHGLCSKCVG
jgi:Fur family zinc uptake transcriptional regulator